MENNPIGSLCKFSTGRLSLVELAERIIDVTYIIHGKGTDKQAQSMCYFRRAIEQWEKQGV